MSGPLPYAAAFLLLAALGCSRHRDASAITAVDLLRHFDNAERRPAQATFELQEHTFGGTTRASLVVPGDSRVTWKLFVPHRGHLQTFIAFPDTARGTIVFRVGVSDGRIYNTVAETTLDANAASGWTPVDVDLSLYAGRQRSLFYRPDRTRWQIILATRVLSGHVPQVYLGMPALLTDVEGAREYLRRLTNALP